MWNTSICSQRRVHKLTVEASFECFRFFRSENLKIWKSWRRHFSSENLKNCSRRLRKLKIWNYVTIFSFSNRNDSNCESEEISSDFQFFRWPCLSPIWKLTSQIWNRTQAAHIWKSEECATQTCFSELLKTRPFSELQIFRSEESEALKQGLESVQYWLCPRWRFPQSFFPTRCIH